ncbi:MAG: RHS repeat-associated core domain-containing protein [Paracoccaceae bacterium]
MRDYDPTTGRYIQQVRLRDFTHNTPRYVQIIWFDGVPVAVVDGRDFLDPHGSHRAACFCGRCQWHEDVGASYLPFGGARVASTDVINLRFPGQWLHAEPGLHQNWMRDYDPTTGRYLQADPLGLVAGVNLYGYPQAQSGPQSGN